MSSLSKLTLILDHNTTGMKEEKRCVIKTSPIFVGAILAFAVASSLSSCGTYYASDPDYPRLIAHAESNPRPDAIVGMWHRQLTVLGSPSYESLLVQANGTVIERESHTPLILPWPIESQTRVWTWKYSGNGVWMLIHPNGQDSWNYRLAQNHLLREMAPGAGSVFVRVD